jgi:hypothetical protein
MICPNCGISNLGHARFCQECGSEIAVAQPVAQMAETQLEAEQDVNEPWVKAIAVNSKIPVYDNIDSGSESVAEILPGKLFQLNGEINKNSKTRMTVRLPDGRTGYIDNKAKIITEQAMTTSIGSWGVGMLAIGVLSIALSEFLNPLWGVLLIAAGILALLNKKRYMFIVFGLVLILAGIMNMFAGGQWIAFGILQCSWGANELYKYFSYAALDK